MIWLRQLLQQTLWHGGEANRIPLFSGNVSRNPESVRRNVNRSKTKSYRDIHGFARDCCWWRFAEVALPTRYIRVNNSRSISPFPSPCPPPPIVLGYVERTERPYIHVSFEIITSCTPAILRVTAESPMLHFAVSPPPPPRWSMRNG